MTHWVKDPFPTSSGFALSTQYLFSRLELQQVKDLVLLLFPSNMRPSKQSLFFWWSNWPMSSMQKGLKLHGRQVETLQLVWIVSFSWWFNSRQRTCLMEHIGKENMQNFFSTLSRCPPPPAFWTFLSNLSIFRPTRNHFSALYCLTGCYFYTNFATRPFPKQPLGSRVALEAWISYHLVNARVLLQLKLFLASDCG